MAQALLVIDIKVAICGTHSAAICTLKPAKDKGSGVKSLRHLVAFRIPSAPVGPSAMMEERMRARTSFPLTRAMGYVHAHAPAYTHAHVHCKAVAMHTYTNMNSLNFDLTVCQ